MPSPKSSTPEFRFAGFCQIPLDEADIAFITGDEAPSAETLFAWLLSVAEDGYSISFKREVKDNIFKASLTCMNETLPWYGYMLTGQADTLLMAITVLHHKHTMIAEGRWDRFLAVKGRSHGIR